MTREGFLQHLKGMDYEAFRILEKTDLPDMKDIQRPEAYLMNAFNWADVPPSRIYWKHIYERLARYY
jgi:hypothetical protein